MEQIITDIEALKIPCETVTDMKEGEEISRKLFQRLTEGNDGIGLAANQIGINKRVCVIKVNKPIYLINPRIVDHEGEIIYLESCLSFPGQTVRTKRYASITVEADNIANKLFFDGTGIPQEELMNNMDVLECIVAQHEISHLEGKTMFDYEYKLVPRKVEHIPNRNDQVKITNGKQTQSIKFKKFSEFEGKGWTLVK